MASVFQDTVAAAVAAQPWYQRRKDSITALAGTFLQVVNLFAAYATGLPEWATLLIALLVGVAQVAVHAGTKGAITPSMGVRLEQAGEVSHMDRMSLSSQPSLVQAGGHRLDAPLPVYDGPSTGV